MVRAGGGGIFPRACPGGDLFGYLDPDGDDFTFNGVFALKIKVAWSPFGDFQTKKNNR
ncbi:MAG: hypothetical protein CM15mP125_0860 [Gammaproteobacteria bacterium]|nr:MAG: hypothetical protein CM15mP125_0860 [Gammaproteobacteria bacterium]